jgi:undecaprenyl-diphosphatase
MPYAAPNLTTQPKSEPGAASGKGRWKRWWKTGWHWVRNQDLLVLLLSLGVALGLWAFIELADEVKEGSTLGLDARILRALRDPNDLAEPLGPAWLNVMMRDVTALGGVAVLALVTLAVSGFVAIRRQYGALGLLIAAILGGLLLNLILKGVVDRARPEVVPHLMQETSASFPSGHSMLSAVVYVTLGALLARLVEPVRLKVYILSVALLITFLVGVSRIYLGVHYPTDVLAGWTLGSLWAVICWLAARFLQGRGAVEGPQ